MEIPPRPRFVAYSVRPRPSLFPLKVSCFLSPPPFSAGSSVDGISRPTWTPPSLLPLFPSSHLAEVFARAAFRARFSSAVPSFFIGLGEFSSPRLPPLYVHQAFFLSTFPWESPPTITCHLFCSLGGYQRLERPPVAPCSFVFLEFVLSFLFLFPNFPSLCCFSLVSRKGSSLPLLLPFFEIRHEVYLLS